MNKIILVTLLISCSSPGRMWDPQYPQYESCELFEVPQGTDTKVCYDYDGQAYACDDVSCLPITSSR